MTKPGKSNYPLQCLFFLYKISCVRRKTIPVTQFDGTISKPREKKTAAPPPPLPASPPPPLATRPQPLDATTDKTSSSNSASETEPMRGTPSPKSLPRQRTSEGDNDEEMQNAAEITREYETLKAKFDLWQALQAENRNSSEARQLHVSGFYFTKRSSRAHVEQNQLRKHHSQRKLCFTDTSGFYIFFNCSRAIVCPSHLLSYFIKPR